MDLHGRDKKREISDKLKTPLKD